MPLYYLACVNNDSNRCSYCIAIVSEESADIAEALVQLERRLAAQGIGHPALNDAVRILRSTLARWRIAHETLARSSMSFAQLYEDESCGLTE